MVRRVGHQLSCLIPGFLQPGQGRTLGTESVVVNACRGGVQALGLIVGRKCLGTHRCGLGLDLGAEAIGEGLGTGQQSEGCGAGLLRGTGRFDRGLVQSLWRGGHILNRPICTGTFTSPVHRWTGQACGLGCLSHRRPR